MLRKAVFIHIMKSSVNSRNNYKLLYTKRALKDIQKLDIVVQKKIEKALKKLKQNPVIYSIKLLDKRLGSYRFRIGDHRVIFDLEGNKIIILRVGHRDKIYK